MDNLEKLVRFVLPYAKKYDVLCLILFYSDFLVYGEFGESLSGTDYVKRGDLPVPNGLDEILARMGITPNEQGILVSKEEIALSPIIYFDNRGKYRVVIHVIDHWQNWGTPVPVKLARQGETIPYFTVFGLQDIPLSDEVQMSQRFDDIITFSLTK
jgi:hypothetical protein